MSAKRRDARRINKTFLIVFVLAIGLIAGGTVAAEDSQPAAPDVFTRDMDLDDDGVENVEDNCPLVYNPVQDMDGDGIGEACNNGYDLDLDGIFDSVETYLINTFAPVVILYSSDYYRPAGVEWLFQQTTAPLLGEYAGPGGEPWWLFSPIGDGINLLGVEYNGFSSGPPPVADTYAFKIDMMDGFAVKYGNLISAPFYATVARDLYVNRFAIAYWFFYPYNGCITILPMGIPIVTCDYTHEGDWEHVILYVEQDPTNREHFTGIKAAYAYHESIAVIEWHDLNTDFSGGGGNRPYVFSADETHASYKGPGNQISPVPGAPVNREDHTDWGMVWNPRDRILMDLTSGPPYPSSPMQLDEGKGILNVGERPLNRSRNYFAPNMGVPMPGMEWILYDGRWGEEEDGVKSPLFNWYELDDTSLPPALWKALDQEANAGVPNLFTLGLIRDPVSKINSQTLNAMVYWGDGFVDQLSGGVPDDFIRAFHTYAAPGVYYVEVIVVNDWNLWGGNIFKVSVNGAPTDIALSNDTLTGNMPVGSLVGNFSTTDPALPAEPFVYELVPGEGADDNASFSISGDQLLSAAIFNSTVKNTYSIRVRATDAGGMYWEEIFNINVAANHYTPTLLTPGDGENLLTDRPTFDWTDVLAKSYSLQIARNSTFTSLVTTKTLTASTYTPSADLPANTTLYWRVKINKTGVVGPWSLIRWFHTANPPGVPVLSSPANNALVTIYTTKLDWTNSTVPAGTPAFQKYQVQVATDAGFASIVYDQEPTLSEFTPPSPWVKSTKYFWRVRAFNTANEYSAWSLVRSFRAAILPPVLVSPANTTTPVLSTTVPFFEWEADFPGHLYGITGYTIQVSPYSNLSSPVVNVTVPSYPYFPARGLLKNKVYYWRVRAEGLNGPSLWSSVWTFKTGNPPSTPVLVSPANRALLTDYTPTLTWRASTPAAGLTVDSYEVWVATDANFNDLVYRDYVGNVTTFTFYFALPPNTSCYWRVRALGSNGHYTPWSLTRSFRMSVLAPVLVSPTSGSSTTGHKPSFEWQAVDGATGYTVQISISSSFGTILENKTVTTLTYIPTANLPHRIIYWRVRANGPNGPSTWTAGNFTILP